ncbi:hypothetical protein LWI28_028636 [Acer negundo]|uniref:Kinesin-like protein n=1 Tax=Acer negundo TaxID=4023 RepID=A0AAD5J8U9_ACENE|nr:hypothetical protein LWI28_028636 [Acer negundo]
MTTEEVLPFSVASVLEEVLQQNGTRSRVIDLASRKAEEAALRRYEAAMWLRRIVGVVGGKDLPAQPSEEEFRLALRSGIVLCNVLNKIQPGAVPKVVEGPSDSVIIPDGAALSAFQYFENVRNFLVAVEELGLPTFEASDFEQGGKSATARIINCVLALKSYSEWKQSGGHGSWKFGANGKPSSAGTGKPFMRKNSEPFMNSFSRTLSVGEKSLDSDLSTDLSEAVSELCLFMCLCYSCQADTNKTPKKPYLRSNLQGSSGNLNSLVRAFLSDRKQEEIPSVVESMLNKVMEEFERRLASQNEQMKAAPTDVAVSVPDNSLTRSSSGDVVMEDEFPTNKKMVVNTAECEDQNYYHDEVSETQLLKRQMLVELQQRNILELKQTLHITKEGMQLLQIKYQEEFNNFGKHLHSLASAASGYQRVLEENRKLYNQVQDLKGNIRVYCRVRPFLNGQPNLVTTVDSIEEGNIVITIPSKYGKESRRLFSFNKVFGPAATQAAVFEDTQALIRSVLDGFNVCIFAYGQTGSGKTFTMTGPNELTEESLGVNYRALSDLFVLANQRRDTMSYDISVQMLEIYNEQVRDLLVTDEIRNSSQNGINVPEANLVPVSSTSDVINLMNLGHKNRAVSSTAMNDRSSRSHSCLTVHVQGRNLTSGGILRGSMHLVDLAGSERVDKSEVTGDRLKEAQHINKSLAALGDVIASLAQKSTHVPYRNSKLTQLLQDSLGGQAKTLMFVHISPEPDALGETLSTLKFAERVATVELGAARVNKDGSDVKELKDQIVSLKAALARKDGESEHLQFARPSTPDRLKMKSGSSSPSNSSLQSVGDVSSNRRQPMEEVGNTQVRKQSAIKPRRKSLDPRDLLASSPPWPTVGIPVLNRKEEDRESVSGDWVDKVMVNKDDILYRDDNLLTHWEADNTQSEKFYQNYPRDLSKIYPEQTMNSLIPSRRGDCQDYDVIQRSRSEVASTTDDSDHEAATSDCSEPDSLLHFNIQKASSIPSGLGSIKKKIQPKTVTKSIETRSLIPSLIPSPPTRNLKNSLSLNKSGRQPLVAEGKRKTGHGK